MTVEIFNNDDVDNTLHIYSILEKLVDKMKEIFYIKIPYEDSLVSTRVTSDEMLKAIALSTLFELDLIKNTAISKNWENDKKNWISDKIQRFGFVIVDLENSFKFIHINIAEYFVAKYLLSFMYEFDQSRRDEELKNVFQILRFVAESDKYNIIHELLFDYRQITNSFEVSENFGKIIAENLSLIFDDILNSQNKSSSLHFWILHMPDSCGDVISLLSDPIDLKTCNLPKILQDKILKIKNLL